MFIEKDPTLLEYATFFGSIQIMKYLWINNVELTSSLWIYAVHSNNPEVIHFLEDKNIEFDDKTFSKAIKDHHNEIAHYIFNNYFDSSTKISDLDDDVILTIFSSANYDFFPSKIDGNNIFFSLCQNEYNELIDFYLKLKEKKIKKYIKRLKKADIKTIIIKALKEKKIHVAYSLLQNFDCIPNCYFEYDYNITKIALPSSVVRIGNGAFYSFKTIFDSSPLTRISIPSSVTSIGESAFYHCSSLKEISIISNEN